LEIFQTVKEKYEKQPVTKLFFHVIALYLAWEFFYLFLHNNEFLYSFYRQGTTYFRIFLVYTAHILLEIFGFSNKVWFTEGILQMAGTKGIWIGEGCMGRNMLGLFAGFIIAYPGIISKKIWFIPSGIAAITVLNIIRVAALVLVQKYAPEYMEINHHVVFKYAVYTLIFLMWTLWITKINVLKKPVKR